MKKKIFLSPVSFDEAIFKAKMKGYKVIGKARNKAKKFVVFGRKKVYLGWKWL